MSASIPYPNLRPIVMKAYTAHLIQTFGNQLRVVRSADGLIELAKTIPIPEFEAAEGWRTVPQFPGMGEKPEEMPDGWRMICASRLYSGNVELGVIYMNFYSGKPLSVFLSPPGTDIPAEYTPITG
jgi:hypothetical protein